MLDLKQLSEEAQSHVTYLKGLIQKASKKYGVSPRELGYQQLQKWASNNDPEFFKKQTAFRLIGGFSAIRDSLFPITVEDVNQNDFDRLNIKKNKTAVSKENTETIKRIAVLDGFQKACEKIFKDKIVPSGYAKKSSNNPVEREVTLVLGDTHFHSFLKREEGFINYKSVEEARRLANVTLETAEYKKQYRDVTKLRVLILGDIIAGIIHSQWSSAPLSDQMAAASWLLSQSIGYLASRFPSVEVYCCPGNHGRNPLKHPKKATDQKFDSFETSIYYTLKLATASLKNVKFHIDRTGYITYKSFGVSVFATHGDTIFTTGDVGSNINVNNIERQINHMNASMPSQEQYKLFIVGHIHVGSLIHLTNGVRLITNGALVPPDSYAHSIGIFSNTCGQFLFESVEGHIVGDTRFIEVDSTTDQDESLDNVIQPFTGY